MPSEKQRTCRLIVLLSGGPADEPVVEMACLLARQRGAQLYLVHAILVERSLALDAPLPEAVERARTALDRAQRVAAAQGCPAQTRELRTRDVAAALVDEAADLGCDEIVLGVAGEQRGMAAPLAIAEQVLRQAPCPVWIYRGHPRR